MVACNVFILLFYISFMKIAEAQNKACVLDKDKDFPTFPLHPPLILETISKNIVLPVKENGKRIIRVASGTSLTMSCYGLIGRTSNKNSFSSVIFPFPANLQDVVVKCNNGKLEYGSQNQVIAMKGLGCVSKIKGGTRYTRDKCGSQGQIYEIGFNSINSNNKPDFYTQMKVCFAGKDDDSSETTLWTEHTLHGRNLDARDPVPQPLNPQPPTKKRPRPGFSSDISPFTPEIEYIYTIAAQKTIGSLKNLINPGDKYFARGHLAPAADFVTQPEMDTTFAFINAVPQWQQINNGNWGVIEHNIRKLASTRKSNMRIFTGGFGILKDGNGNNLYLGDTDSFATGQQKVPIPESTWKIVIDQTSKQGVAFYVSNNPFSTTSPVALSTNICSTLTWLGKLDTKKEKGHTYCFTIDNFKKEYPSIFSSLPGDINLKAVLLN